MGQGGFWGSFYQGWNQGDKINERNKQLRLEKDAKNIYSQTPQENSVYSPDQASQIDDYARNGAPSDATWVPDNGDGTGGYYEKDGQRFDVGSRPTVSADGTYSLGGQQVAPTRNYSLGDQQQATQFSPEQIEAYRNTQMANRLAQDGNWREAAGLRAAAQQQKLADIQIQGAQRQETQSQAQDKLLQFARESANMSDDEFYANAAKMATSHGNDGKAFGWQKGDDGKYYGFQVDATTHQMVGKPTPLTRDSVIQQLYSYTSPQAFQQGVQNGLEQRRLGQGDRTLDQKDSEISQTGKYQTGVLDNQRQTLEESSRHNKVDERLKGQEISSNASLRGAMLEASKDRGAWQLVGRDGDGAGVVFDQHSGKFMRTDGAAVQDPSFFKRLTGDTAPKAMFKDPNDAVKYAASIYPDWDKMPVTNRTEIIQGLMGGSAGTPANRVDVPPPPMPGQNSAPAPSRGLFTPGFNLNNMSPDELRRATNLSPQEADLRNRLLQAWAASNRAQGLQAIGR